MIHSDAVNRLNILRKTETRPDLIVLFQALLFGETPLARTQQLAIQSRYLTENQPSA